MIRFVFRWLFRFALLAIVLVIGLLLLKDNLARSYLEQQIRRKTGFDAKIGKVQLSLLEPRVTLENLVIYNPAEFGGSPLVDAPDVQLEYAPRDLAEHKVHFKLLRLNIRELNLAENNGRTNVFEVLPRTPTGSGKAVSSFAFDRVDLLNLSVARVRWTDLQHPKRNQEINLALENYIMRDVRSEQEVVNLLMKQIFRAGITIYVEERPRSKPDRK